MKSFIIIAFTLVFLIPTGTFAQESISCPSGAYHGLDNAGNDACRDIETNKIVEPLSKSMPESDPSLPESKITSPSSPSEIITFGDNTIVILLVGLVVIAIIGISAFKVLGKNNLNKQKQKENKKIKERIQREEEEKLKEKERLEKIRDEKRKQQELEDREGEKARLKMIEMQKRKRIEEEKLQNELKQKEIQEEQEFQEKIKHNEILYDYTAIESLQDTASLRIFYDLEKKSNKYWNETGLLNRIHFKDDEIKEEIKNKQNKVTLRISVESGGKHKFAKLISGGNMEFWDHDVGGYNLQVHFSKPEEFLKAVMMKHIRLGLSKVQIHESEYSISAILVRQDADYADASNILKRIVKAFCDEMLEAGDILVEK